MPQTRHYEMKDSGVGSVGNIPKHWRATSLKRALWAIKDGTHGTYERVASGKMLLSAKNVFDDGIHIGNSESLISEESFNEVISSGFPKKGDVLMCIVGTIGRACVYEKNEPMAFQRSVAFLRPNELITSQFLKYTLQSPSTIEEEELGSNGTAQVGLYLGAVQKLPVILPPLSEQTAIAAYLDEKCATIDAIIAEAKASIEEYKSWKASVIFETVTKGLNPNAEMKDSGVEWIGEIPKGWEVSAVKRHYSITLGKMLESVPQSNDATLENYMCASNVKWGGIDTTTNRQMWFSPIEKEEYLLKEGDLLVMEGGSAGTSAIYRGEYAPCYMQNSVNRCRSKDGSLTHFLYYWMFLVYHSGHVESACNRATIMHLTKEKLGRLPFVYAPEEEQASIVSCLDRKCSLIDGIILEKEDLIRELETYKKSLIFEVVTGKRRVC